MAAESPAPLRFRLLGGFVVSLGERTVAPAAWRLAKARALVKLLALAPGNRLYREQALDALWPDFAPEAALKNLYSTLTDARRALAPATIRLAGGVLALDAPDGIAVDVIAFEQATAAALRTGAAADFATALALYGGDLLPEDRYEEWALPRREQLQATHQQLLLALAERQQGDDAIATLRRVLAADPLHEGAHLALMRLHAARGEQVAAIRQYQALRAALADGLDAEPSPTARRLYATIATGQDDGERATAPTRAAPRPSRPQPPPLPRPLTSFVGREDDLTALHALLRGPDTARLVTLTGIGGTGKTRLALATAEAIKEAYPAGVWFVDLVPLADPALVAATVAAALGVRPGANEPLLPALIDALRDRELLLVLDNCEQLAGAIGAFCDALLQGCPLVQVLATSRESLQVAGEVAWPVRPLTLPPQPDDNAAPPTLAAVAETAAGRLFIARARERQPRLALTDADAPAVAAICRRLDGLPLALELAAARTAILSLTQLAARLDGALALLATRERAVPARQQTLRATLDWSHALLAPPEQRLLARLAVFVGGGTLAAIEAVAGEDDPTLLDALVALCGHGLVQRHESDGTEPRFRLLELVREYARERLAARDETAAIRQRHTAYFLALAEEVSGALAGAEQAAGQRRLGAEADNLRAALGHAAERRDGVAGLRLAGALALYWATRGEYREGQTWLDTFLADDLSDGTPPVLRARALYGALIMTWRGGDYAAARVYGERALSLYRALDDRHESARTLRVLANVALIAGEHTAAATALDEAETLARAGNDPLDLARVLNSQGELARSVYRDYEGAARRYREALALARVGGTQEGVATFLGNLGTVVLQRGDTAEALRLHRESLELRLAVGHQRGIAISIEFFGAIAIVLGQFAQAARLYGAAERLRELLASPRDSDPADEAEHRRYLARAAAQTDAASWTADWAIGRTLTPAQAVAEALTLSGQPRPRA